VNYVTYSEEHITLVSQYIHTFVTTALKAFRMSSLPTSSKAITSFNALPPLNGNNPSVRFTSTLAREIRNPLTTINLSVEMLNSAVTDKELKPYLDIIMRGSLRIHQLINDLLKYQDIEDVS